MGLTLVASLAGGALIGASASALLLFNGRIAGVSGILAGIVTPGRPESGDGGRGWRVLFVAGLVLGGVLLRMFAPSALEAPSSSPVALVAGGLLVGFGTRLGGGCTSGHGVCGISRLSGRSLAATLTFMVVGILSATLVHRLSGGPR